jgi:hypothetical protein
MKAFGEKKLLKENIYEVFFEGLPLYTGIIGAGPFRVF